MEKTNRDIASTGSLLALDRAYEKVRQKPQQQQFSHQTKDSRELQQRQRQQAQEQQQQME